MRKDLILCSINASGISSCEDLKREIKVMMSLVGKSLMLIIC